MRPLHRHDVRNRAFVFGAFPDGDFVANQCLTETDAAEPIVTAGDGSNTIIPVSR